MDAAPPFLEFCGLICLALSMRANHQRAFGSAPGAKGVLALRGGGWTLIALSIFLCVVSFGWSVGLVAVAAYLAVSGILVALLLAWFPKALPWTGAASLTVGFIWGIPGLLQG